MYVPAHLPISRRSDLELPGIETIWGLSFAIQDQDRVYFRLSTDLLLLMLRSLSGWT